jgi:hypothetical protein
LENRREPCRRQSHRLPAPSAWKPGSQHLHQIGGHRQAPGDTCGQIALQRFDADAVDDVAGEGIRQKAAGGIGVDTTRAQIKQRILVQLADSGAMRALDIISVDLEFWLGVDLGVL